MIRAAIFDLDGTLVDSNELHVLAWQETFRHFGKEIPLERLREQIGKGGDQYLPEFLNERELREFGKEADKYRGEIFKKKYLPQVRPFPKVRELFERVRSDGKKIALASSGKLSPSCAAMSTIRGQRSGSRTTRRRDATPSDSRNSAIAVLAAIIKFSMMSCARVRSRVTSSINLSPTTTGTASEVSSSSAPLCEACDSLAWNSADSSIE